MKTPTTAIPGIGPSTAKALSAKGFKSAEDIASSDVASLCAVPGFGPIRAGRTKKAASKIVSGSTSPKSKGKPKKKAAKPKPKPKKKAKAKTKPKSKSKSDKKGKKSSKKGKSKKGKKGGKKKK